MRNYKKKSARGGTTLETMKEAAEEVITQNRPCRAVAREFGICHVSLFRFVKKLQQSTDKNVTLGYKRNRQIFTDEEEQKLSEYVKTASAIYFGLSPAAVRKLAFECAVMFKKVIPENWTSKKIAGADWFSGFLKRHTDISVRTPESTSIARATSFNQYNVKAFYQKLAQVLDRHHFEACDIWNMDETGVTTVQKPSKVVAPKGVKQVGAVTSGERGVLVTVVVAVNGIGNSIPPMFIFPRKNYRDHFVRDGPLGCVGAGNKSGWMTEVEFKTFMEHFVKHCRPTVEKPVLLLLDNHASHLSVEAIQLAKDSGVVMLSFPPHCSHRMQPLDRSVYGPFKRHISASQDSWMRNHPGKPMTIYDIPGLVSEALPKSVTPSNIMSGFRACGICPFNPDIFSEFDFAPSVPTDRPQPEIVAGQSLASRLVDDQPMTTASAPADVQLLAATSLYAQQNAPPPSEVGLQSNAASLSNPQSEASVPSQAPMTAAHENFHTMIPEHDGAQLANMALDEFRLLVPVNVADVVATNGLLPTTSSSGPIPSTSSSEPIPSTSSSGPITSRPASSSGPITSTSSSGLLPSAGSSDDDDQPLSVLSAENRLQAISSTLLKPSAFYSKDNKCSSSFDPVLVLPHPKAGERKITKGGRKRRHAAILTDTPEKRALEAEHENRKSAKKKPETKKSQVGKTNKSTGERNLDKEKKTSNVPKKQTVANKKKSIQKKRKASSPSTSEDDDDDCFCLVCCEPYSAVRKKKEEWIQCVLCKKWSHVDCTDGTMNYICQNCDSDDSQ